MLQEKTFYFIKNKYFQDFPDKGLMQNHETINGEKHGRPCFYALKDRVNPNIYWLIPISSKVKKYTDIYNHKIKKFKSCDTLHFGKVLGEKRVFLIQNMCPITEKYIEEQYVVSGKKVIIDNKLERDLLRKVNKIYSLNNRINILFPNVKKIKQELIRQLGQEKEIVMQNIQKSKPHKQKMVMKFPNRDNNNREMGR